MAAAEARTAWQRTANRYFVQEDAKRAPKLACCPSSSSLSRQVDAGPTSAEDGHNHPTGGFVPFSRNPSGSNLPPDTRWWLQLQPTYGYPKALTHEQLNALEAEVENIRAGINPTSKVHPRNEDDNLHVDDKLDTEPSVNVNYRVSSASIKKVPEVKNQGLKVMHNLNAQKLLNHKNVGEYFELEEMDLVGCSVSKQTTEHYFDPESPWIGTQKTEPWWRTADRDELASLVARKSLDHIENCDLPRPQNTHNRRDPFDQLGCFDHDGILTSSLDWNAQTCGLCKPSVHAPGTPTSGSPTRRHWFSVEEGNSGGSAKPFSCNKDMTEARKSCESDPSKAQLLEALRHSQTRAREAENAAKQAYAEKEHIVKLFFRQASHLFAYRQWFQLLQLEALFFQIKNKDHPVSSLFPVALPWTPSKARKPRKSLQKAAKGKRGIRGGRPKLDISKYALAIALGLSLVGAGLLLGWTIGWMLPTF